MDKGQVLTYIPNRLSRAFYDIFVIVKGNPNVVLLVFSPYLGTQPAVGLSPPQERLHGNMSVLLIV